MAERAMDDEDLNSADGVLREFPHICASVWRDDLYDSETYTRAIQKMLDIAPDAFSVSDIRDDSADTIRGEHFDVSLKSRGVEYSVTLQHQRWLDFDFLKLLLQVNEAHQANGKYYRVSSETMDEGYAFLYLQPDRYADLIEAGIVELYELAANQIEEIAGVHREVEKPKTQVAVATEVLENLHGGEARSPEASVENVQTPPNTQHSRPHITANKTLRKKVGVLGALGGIFAISFALADVGKKIVRIGESVTATEQPQIIKTKSPEILARERQVATIMVGDPTRIDEEKFKHIDEMNFIAQERFLRFYVSLLLPEDDPKFELLLAFSPDGMHEIRTPQQFEKYARTYFPRSQEIFD